MGLGEPLVLSQGTVGTPVAIEDFEKVPWPEWERAESAEDVPAGSVHRAPNYGPVTYGLEGGWQVLDLRQGVEIHGEDGPAELPTPACRMGGLRSAAVLAVPQRVVLRCSDTETVGLMHSAVWSPEGSLQWDQELRHNTMTNHQGLSHPVLPEKGANPEAPISGLPPALLDTYTRWIDLERLRLFTSEPMDIVHMSIRGIPERGFLRRLPDEELYWGDFDSGTLREVEGLPWCPGPLLERDRDGDRVLLHCTSQPDPKYYRFIIEWGVVVDVDEGVVWTLEGTPERLVTGGVVLSERRGSAAESDVAMGALSQVTLGPPKR
jgi:hypothetical protein